MIEEKRKTLAEEISNVGFRCVDPSVHGGWRTYTPNHLPSDKLLIKARYHMKQVLACLYELDRRDVPLCKALSKTTSSLMDYQSCKIVMNGTNKLKLFLSINRKA